jgi:ABC-type multidrug transport system fused ATPase/permease subunit
MPLRVFPQAETQAVSVERIIEYTNVAAEREPRAATLRAPPPSWPAAGRLECRQLALRYRAGLAPALNGVNFVVAAGERVGVCGRTGAGKSSVTVALLRLADAIDGQLLIDGLDTATIGLAALRSRLALIPQEATMFQGDVRLNLDPLGAHGDAELWRVLDEVSLRREVRGRLE